MRVLRDIRDAALSFVACLAVGFLFLTVSQSCEARADTSPDVWMECLDRSDVLGDLRRAGAEEWELRAVERLMRHTSRGPVDIVNTGCGSAGFAHFEPSRLGLNIGWQGPCAIDDPEWVWRVQAVLYSDAGPSVTLRAFRRIVGPAVREALAGGWPLEQMDLIAAAANSSPTEVREIGDSCEWDRDCFVNRWAVTERRKERMR